MQHRRKRRELDNDWE